MANEEKLGVPAHKLLHRMVLTDEQKKALAGALGREISHVDLVELSMPETVKINPTLARPAAILMSW